jgi:hypothetical protein
MAKPSSELVIIGCGKAKIWDRRCSIGKVKAQDAYVGALFRSACRFAKRGGARWLILSAKHGLLRPDQLISKYDVKVGSPGAITPARLRNQWQRLRERPSVAICLASKSYVSLLQASIPQGVLLRAPLNGMDLFERMHWLKAHS